MASSQGGAGSRKHGRNCRSGGVTHSISLYRSRAHADRSVRGNVYHRPAGTCANCESKVGPFVAGPLPRTRVCGTTVRGPERFKALEQAVLECAKRRSELDWRRYAIKAA
jgi:hypothetical protein